MLLFEYDSGELHAAQLGAARREGVDPAVMDAVRSHVLQIVGRPLFPVRWIGEEDPGTGRTAPNRLVAMDPSGQVVSVEVLETLDSVSLVAALARSGRTSSYGWIDLADLYPGGPGAFRTDWNSFRESMPPRPVPGPRLYVITGAVLDDVRPTLETLTETGVEVFEIAQRETSDGRVFVEVTEPVRPGVAMWHQPQLASVADEELRRVLPAGSTPPAAEETGDPVVGRAEPAADEVIADDPAADGWLAADEVIADDPAADSLPADDPAGDEWLAAIARAAEQDLDLVWLQHRKGIRLEGRLHQDGVIELADGRRFTDPTEAAVAASGRPVADGWQLWTITEGGPSLAEALTELSAPRSSGRRRR